MALPTFTPPMSPSSATDQPEIKVRSTEFGDGYSQNTPAGLNNVRRKVALEWEYLESTEKNDLVAFLSARKGCQPFAWTIPGESSSLKWTCAEWTVQALPASLFNLNATFRQTFTTAP